MIRRPPRSTLSSSSAASDVYKRQVSTQSTWGYYAMKPMEQKIESVYTDGIYSEERDPATPYLNPDYRVDLYENTWANILLIVLAISAVIAGVFAYFVIFFAPIASGVPYHKNMWWAFLTIFILNLAVIILMSILERNERKEAQKADTMQSMKYLESDRIKT
eukprot:TRINITY_DN3511_c0_g1_i4.p1 TRINITY_DN3511_c0_g1~~TRINITY_DN3511_c0_g1_i4.p1  ORF type:complete len:169 (+),score=46.63 TRINITY_DN3511_c0_g1_i4:24-509(+)